MAARARGHRTASIGSSMRVVVLALILAVGAVAVPVAGTSAFASGFSALVSDHTTYQKGDQARVCWLMPASGKMTLTDHDSANAALVLKSGDDNGSGCLNGKVSTVGHACLTLDYDTERGAGSEQTCFDVIDGAAPSASGPTNSPTLTETAVLGDAQTDMEVTGSGFQRFSDAAHGVTVFVKGPDGSEVDADDILPGADGTFRIVLHTAPYAPGTYALAARYSFVSGTPSRPRFWQTASSSKSVEARRVEAPRARRCRCGHGRPEPGRVRRRGRATSGGAAHSATNVARAVRGDDAGLPERSMRQLPRSRQSRNRR